MKAVRTLMILLGAALLIVITIGITGCGGDEDTQGEEGEVLVMKPELSKPPTQTPALQDSNPTLPAEGAEVKPEVSDPEPDPEVPVGMPAEPVPDVEEVPVKMPVENVPDEEVLNDPEHDVIDPLENEAREKAIVAMKNMWQRRIDRLIADFENPDPNADWGEINSKIRVEETGISDNVMDRLLAIHYEENPEDLEKRLHRLEDLIVEYLVLSFLHPEKNEEELLDLFREAARDGKTEICLNAVNAMYGIR